MNKRRLLAVVICLTGVASLFAVDFGLLINEAPAIEGSDNDTTFTNTIIAFPWLSVSLGKNTDLYFSAGLNTRFEDDRWAIVPEFYRSALDVRPRQGLSLSLGRFRYEDAFGYIATGLFDGAAFSTEIGEGVLGAGVYYTGLLYKKTAHITMTEADRAHYNEPVEEPATDSFAPRRMLLTLDWKQAGILSEDGTLAAGMVGQVDFTGANYHSQYLSLRYTLPLGAFDAETGFTAELIEDAGQFGCGMAALLNAAWTPPGGPRDRLQLGFRWASGQGNGAQSAFTPVNTVSQGRVLRAKLSGLICAEALYRLRILESLSGNIGVFGFLRSDTETYWDSDLGTGDAPLLGAELNAELLWVPVSDLSISLGGGVFLPGPAMRENAAPRWRVSLGFIFGL
ncbi:MAG: hypothetical protein LBT39_04760 [Treponema sp.]|jgi:hypothetical protein|nr:hypothetical protein [Treponema sp.]